MKHIFISHAGQDTLVAEELANNLKNAGHETVVDTIELGLGDDSINFMNEGIKNAHTIIILYSKHTPSANWQKLEINASVWNEVAQSGGTCIILRIDDTPIPPLLGPKVYGKLERHNLKQTIDDICAAILPKRPASSIVSKAFGPSQKNPFRLIRAEYFEDDPQLLAQFFAPPDVLKTGALEDKIPCFLEGSRGTGKSMLLLSLRARNYLLRRPDSRGNEIFGFYLKLTRGAVCNVGVLRHSEVDPETVSAQDAIQIADLFMQEIILCLLESLFSEIVFCIKANLVPCGKPDEQSLASAVYVAIYGESAEKPRSIEHLMEYMAETHRRLAEFIRRRFIYGESPTVPIASLDLELLKRVIEQVRNSIPAMQYSQYVVLLDEYETLFPYQQLVVNTLVKHGPPSFSIKIAKKLGTGDIAGTTSGQDLQETHDYHRILLVYDVEDKSQLAAYNLLLKHFIERIFVGEGLEFKSLDDFLPESVDAEVPGAALDTEIARLCKVTELEFRAWPDHKRAEKSTYYRYAATYRVLYGGSGRHREKHFSGFKDLAFLSSGVIRYFQEILGVAYYLQCADSALAENSIVLTSEVQSKAVHFVSQHNLTTLSRNVESVGETLKYFLLDLGDCLRRKLLTHGSEPEAARITISDPESLENERFVTLKKLLMVGTREGVFQTKEGRPAFKPKHSSDPQPAEFNICRIYAPVLQISPRLRWRTNVSCSALLKLTEPAERAKGKRELMKRICRNEHANEVQPLLAAEESA